MSGVALATCRQSWVLPPAGPWPGDGAKHRSFEFLLFFMSMFVFVLCITFHFVYACSSILLSCQLADTTLPTASRLVKQHFMNMNVMMPLSQRLLRYSVWRRSSGRSHARPLYTHENVKNSWYSAIIQVQITRARFTPNEITLFHLTPTRLMSVMGRSRHHLHPQSLGQQQSTVYYSSCCTFHRRATQLKELANRQTLKPNDSEQ